MRDGLWCVEAAALALAIPPPFHANLQACPLLLLDEMCGALSVDEVLNGDEESSRIKPPGDVFSAKRGPPSKSASRSVLSGGSPAKALDAPGGDQQLAAKLKREKEMLDKQLEEVSAEAARLQVSCRLWFVGCRLWVGGWRRSRRRMLGCRSVVGCGLEVGGGLSGG